MKESGVLFGIVSIVLIANGNTARHLSVPSNHYRSPPLPFCRPSPFDLASPQSGLTPRGWELREASER